VLQLSASSISRHVWDLMQSGNLSLRVMAEFEHACDLVMPEHDVVARDVIALVTLRIGNGPLNIVVDDLPGGLALLQRDTTAPGMDAPNRAAMLSSTSLRVGHIEVELGGAQIWEPRPDWDALRAAGDTIRHRLKRVAAIARARAPAGSLLSSASPGSDLACIASTIHAAAADLAQGWHGQSGLIRSGAARIAGLGNGLTPAGDDFLCGVMLWAWLAHPDPEAFCRALAEAAAPRTTTLSAAFLRAAARGECHATWHALLAQLAWPGGQLAPAVDAVLAHGATSGADILAGFTWMGTWFQARRAEQRAARNGRQRQRVGGARL
jgi:hypothetical protein